MKQRQPRAIAKARPGYGIALLMVFITSTVLIGASLQMMAGPIGMAYLGSSSQDNLAAREVAMSGMETVIADIQTQLNNNQTVDTSYTYASTPVTIPTDPTAPAGATTTVGSYSATLTYARGDGYLVKVTATVGSATYMLSRVINLTRASSSKYVLDSVSGATAAYGLRKLGSSYSGSAIRVRRSTDNTEQDIGFNANGELDLVSLQSFLGTNTRPLDSVGTAAAAFGLRRLRSAYTGYAIRVRRSSDNTEQDIGFNLNDDLDIRALLDFVGSGSGYVKTWYDQSGNAVDATQSTTSAQPIIVSSGQLMMVKNRVAVKYDGTDDALRFSRTISDDFSILACFSTIAGVAGAGGQWYTHAGIVDMEEWSTTNDFGISADTAGNVYTGVGNADSSLYLSNGGYNDGFMHHVTMIRKKSTGEFREYTDSGYFNSRSSGNTNSLNAASAISIGRVQTNALASLNGYISEVLVYASTLSNTNRVTLERNEAQYFGIRPVLTATKPLDLVGSASVAYGLRQMRNAYSGSLIRVRRSSDNTEQDIGMIGENLDVSSLLTFAGSGSAYIKTWYDQSGNGKNLTQTTTSYQPRIVNAGSLETSNDKPAAYFDGGDYMYNSAMTGFISGANLTSFLVGSISASSSIWGRLAVLQKTGDADDYTTSTSMNLLGGNGTTTDVSCDTNNSGVNMTVASATLFQAVCYHDSSNNLYGYINGALHGTDSISNSIAPDYLVVGASRSGSSITDNFTGYVSEVIIYNSALSGSNIVSVETNQMSYFAPSWPVGYITKWYDQSGNGNDVVQTNPLNQPTISYTGDGGVLNRPTVVFSSDYNNTGYGTWLTSSTGMPTSADYSKSAVFSYRTTALSGGLLQNNIISSAPSVSGHALFTAGTSNLYMFHNGSFVTSGSSLSANTSYAVAATYTQSSKGGVLYLYNTQSATGTAANSNTNAGINLGAYLSQSALNGTISEAIIFNKVLSSSERSILYYDQQAYYGAR